MSAPGIWAAEFLVNSVTESAQMNPVITALAGGRFAVAYADFSETTGYGATDQSDSAIRVQVFHTDGSACSPVVQVNTVTTFHQQSPRIAPLDDGGFVVAFSDLSIGWNSGSDDIWAEAVRMQRFTHDGFKEGIETRVNTTVVGDQDHPSIALLDNGRFLVAWDDGYWDVDENISAQLFNADGSIAGEEITLNDNAAGSQTGSDIAALPGGGFAVTWVDAGAVDGDGGTIMARMFAADGTPLADEFQVNSTAAGDQFQPSITALTGGGFFVVWADNSRGVETGGDDISSYAIRGQVFDAAGVPLGAEFLVNQATIYGQYQPDVLALSDGRFIVAYSDTSSGLETGGDDTEFGAIRARIFQADGTPDGDEFLVNTTTTGHQNEPQLAELPDGRVVFTWSDYSYGVETGGDDADNGAIRARILDLRDAREKWSGGDGSEEFTGTSRNDILRAEGGDDRIVGGDGKDRVYAGHGDDVLIGDGGPDVLRGNAGDDTLYGGLDNDRLYGGRNDDTIYGDQGADQIEGGPGNDLLTGGAGADSFVYADTDETGTETGARDVITDFEPGVDRLDLSEIDAVPGIPGDDAFVFIGLDSFSGQAGELRYTRGSTQSVVKLDLDGDGSVDMAIELTGWQELDADDFVL